MNRVKSCSYPDTITDVIYQSGQFTPAMTGWLDSVLASGGYTILPCRLRKTHLPAAILWDEIAFTSAQGAAVTRSEIIFFGNLQG